MLKADIQALALKLVITIAECQRARYKHDNDRKAVQLLRTGALYVLFEKSFNWNISISVTQDKKVYFSITLMYKTTIYLFLKTTTI